jgi:heterodisulfide reductase subunit C
MSTDQTIEKEVLTVNPSFKYRVMKADGGDSLKVCFQCGTCTSTCPIARFTKTFRPNKLIHMAKLGIPDLLKDDSIWMCVSCYACTERCPQGLEVTEIMRVFKNLSNEDGFVPAFYADLMANIFKTGSAYVLSKSRLKRRDSLGLPPLPQANVGDLKKIADSIEKSKG